LINQKKFNLVRISDEQPISAKTNVILCDKMGVLRSLYGLAHFAFVGGSIAERGGHNALEPAACKTPILMGPSRFNNPAICKALADVDALTLVETAEQIAHQCHYWLTHKQERINQGIAGSEILNNNKGALEKTLKIIGFDKPT
jgi:3-deoxy-D-manno-octulosonic-acid transferase